MVFLGFYHVNQWKAKIKQCSYNTFYIPFTFRFYYTSYDAIQMLWRVYIIHSPLVVQMNQV